MGILADLLITFSTRGVQDVRSEADRVKQKLEETQHAAAAFGRQIEGAFRVATASMVGFTTAGLHGTVQGQQLTYQFQLLSREIAGVFLPVVERLTNGVRSVTEWLRGLSRSQQDSLLKWGLIVGGVTLAARAFVSVATTVRGLNALLFTNAAAATAAAAANTRLAAANAAAAASGMPANAAALQNWLTGGAAAAGGGAAAAGAGRWAAARGIGMGAARGLGYAGAAAGVGLGIGAGINYLAHGSATPSGILDEKVKGRSAEDIYAEAAKQRGQESFLYRWGMHTLNNLVPGVDLRPVSDQLKDQAISARRGHRDVQMAGGQFEGITDMYRRIASSMQTLGGPAGGEKTDEQILKELQEMNKTLKDKLEVGLK